MPVIIDQLELVDTQPDPPREGGPPPALPGTATVGQTMWALRVAAQRSARVVAD
jgi:hypothetical protein